MGIFRVKYGLYGHDYHIQTCSARGDGHDGIQCCHIFLTSVATIGDECCHNNGKMVIFAPIGANDGSYERFWCLGLDSDQCCHMGGTSVATFEDQCCHNNRKMVSFGPIGANEGSYERLTNGDAWQYFLKMRRVYEQLVDRKSDWNYTTQSTFGRNHNTVDGITKPDGITVTVGRNLLIM